MKRNQSLQHSKQPDTVVQDETTTLETNQMIPSTSKRVPSEQVARSDFAIFSPLIFHIVTETQKRDNFRDVIRFNENPFYNSTIFVVFGKHSNDMDAILLIRENRDPYFCSKTFHSIFILKVVNQILLIYVSLWFLTPLKTLKLEFTQRQ